MMDIKERNFRSLPDNLSLEELVPQEASPPDSWWRRTWAGSSKGPRPSKEARPDRRQASTHPQRGCVEVLEQVADELWVDDEVVSNQLD